MNGRVRVVFSSRLGPITAAEHLLEDDPRIAFEPVPLPDGPAIVERARHATVIMIGAVEPLEADVLARLASLALIVRRGVGVDNVDVNAATGLGIAVANIPDATVEEVSDHALALLLAAERRVAQVDRAIRAGAGPSVRSMVDTARRFGDMTLGVVGLGRIGSRLAQKAVGLFGTVLGYDLAPVEVPGVDRVVLDELLRRSHALSLHLPLTSETRGFVDADLLARCRPGVILVNTARGELVDESALLGALREGQVAAAGLDVMAEDPPRADHPLLAMDSVVVSGHTAARGAHGSRELRRRSVQAVLDAVEGRPPEHLLNPDAWGKRPLH